METFKRWHSSHNLLWLKCDNHLNHYSSFQSILACLHPIIVLFAIIVYVFFTTAWHEGDTQHFVTFKDAKPHWRVEDHYYNHMTEELNFTILNNQIFPPPFKLSQYYPNSGCLTQMQCSKLIAKNHNLGSQDINKIIEFSANSSNQELKANGILCYTERVNNYYEHGLVLCNNHQYTLENPDESVIVSVESKKKPHLFELEMKKDTSYIATFQLWTNYKGNGKWEGNEINVINVEEMKSKQFRIPILNNKNDEEEEEECCYGLKVVQDRIVYEIEDGMNLKRFFENAFWFILLVYFISLCGLRGIDWICKQIICHQLNNVNVYKCVPKQTNDDGEKHTIVA